MPAKHRGPSQPPLRRRTRAPDPAPGEEGDKVGALVLGWFFERTMRERYLRKGDFVGVNACERALDQIEMRLVKLGELPPRRAH